MTENTTQNKLIIVLTAVLLAVLVASGIILFLLPSSESDNFTDVSPEETESVGVTTNSAGSVPTGSFRLDVLQRQAYQLLNKQLVREGARPVKPPTTVGKANPFL